MNIERNSIIERVWDKIDVVYDGLTDCDGLPIDSDLTLITAVGGVKEDLFEILND